MLTSGSTPEIPPKLGVVVDHGSSGTEWAARYARGQRHEPSPWEYSLAGRDFELTYSFDHPENRLVTFIRKALRRALGFDLVHVWRNRRLILEQDVVWAHTEKEHLAISALLLARRKTGTILIGQSVWLYDDLERYSGPHKFLIRRLLNRLNVETLHTASGVRAAKAFAPGRVVMQLPFGSSYRPIAKPDEPDSEAGRPLIVAPGNDKHRDWDVLLRTAAELPEVDFLIACSPEKLRSSVSAPANVLVRRLDGVAELKEMYIKAAAIVVPLKSNCHASGVTVALEAIAQNVPLVTCLAGGIEEYLPREGVHLYQRGNDDSLKMALIEVLNGGTATPDGVAYIESRGLRAVDYVARHILITKALLSGDVVPMESVCRFSSVEGSERLG